MDSLYASLSLVSIYALYALYKRYTRISISDIPGPKPSSFMLGTSGVYPAVLTLTPNNPPGNMPELMLSECGVTESKWQAEFGNVVRVKASFGVREIIGLRHPIISNCLIIFRKTGYGFRTRWPSNIFSRLLATAIPNRRASSFSPACFLTLESSQRTVRISCPQSASITHKNLSGHVNKRQRRVITPAFRLAECKAFVPMFQEVVGKASGFHTIFS